MIRWIVRVGVALIILAALGGSLPTSVRADSDALNVDYVGWHLASNGIDVDKVELSFDANLIGEYEVTVELLDNDKNVVSSGSRLFTNLNEEDKLVIDLIDASIEVVYYIRVTVNYYIGVTVNKLPALEPPPTPTLPPTPPPPPPPTPTPTPPPTLTPTPTPPPTLTPTPTPPPEPEPESTPLEEVTLEVKPPINWPLVGGIIAGVVVVGLLVSFLIRRKLKRRAH